MTVNSEFQYVNETAVSSRREELANCWKPELDQACWTPAAPRR